MVVAWYTDCCLSVAAKEAEERMYIADLDDRAGALDILVGLVVVACTAVAGY